MTTDPDQRRRRLIAAAAMWFLIAGLLTAVGLVLVVLAISALALVAGVTAILVNRAREVDLTPAMRAVERSTGTAVDAVKTHRPRPQVRRRARSVAAATRTATKAAISETPGLATRAARGSLGAMYRLGILRLQSLDPHQRVQALNELGSQLRRDGEPEQAAQQHRAALALVRDLDDPQAEAVTLNNLGLALAHSGAGDAAVEHLEQAVDVLRELGDEEHEARVIVNLGLVHRRQGHQEEAVTLLHEALDKLPPESPDRRRVERELVRAG